MVSKKSLFLAGSHGNQFGNHGNENHIFNQGFNFKVASFAGINSKYYILAVISKTSFYNHNRKSSQNLRRGCKNLAVTLQEEKNASGDLQK